MSRRFLSALGAALAFTVLPLGVSDAFLVIVNSSVKATSMPVDEVSRAFLGKVEAWPDGTKVKPIDLLGDSPVREAFTQAIHSRPVEAVQKYWQKQIFSGRAVPPPEASEEEAIKFVATTPGAIGYVSDGAQVNANAGLVVIKVE